MIENWIEAGHSDQRCRLALDDWGLDPAERRQALACGITAGEPGGAVALDTRRRHLVDVDRAVAGLVQRASLVPVWLRLPQEALDGLSPIELILAHPSGLRLVRDLLVRERLECGFVW